MTSPLNVGALSPDVRRALVGLQEYTDRTATAAALSRVTNASPYTPQVSQSGAVTFNLIFSQWGRIGPWVHWEFMLTITGAGTAGQPVRILLPVAAAATPNANFQLGSGQIFDSDLGTRDIGMWEAIGVSPTLAQFGSDRSDDTVWGVVPSVGLAVNDQLRGNLLYLGA